MARANLAVLVADAWREEVEEGPDPFQESGEWLFERLRGVKPRPYGEQLVRKMTQARTYKGDVIPHIRMVRRNLSLLGNIRLDPARLR